MIFHQAFFAGAVCAAGGAAGVRAAVVSGAGADCWTDAAAEDCTAGIVVIGAAAGFVMRVLLDASRSSFALSAATADASRTMT